MIKLENVNISSGRKLESIYSSDVKLVASSVSSSSESTRRRSSVAPLAYSIVVRPSAFSFSRGSEAESETRRRE